MTSFVNSTATSYRKKLLFNHTLSAALYDSKYKINASYSWEQGDQVFTIALDKNNTIHLQINLNFNSSPLFDGEAHALELTLLFRAYFIESYVRLLENAHTSVLSDYFTGVVLLEVISDICNKRKIKGFTLKCDSNQGRISLADIHCSIQAITRVLVNLLEQPASNTAMKCRNYLNTCLDVSEMPEVCYSNSKQPMFTAVVIFSKLQDLLSNHADRCGEFYALSIFKELPQKAFSVSILEDICVDTGTPFWYGLYARLTALSTSARVSSQLRSLESFADCVKQFKERCMAFYTHYINSENHLIKNNIEAIKQLTRGINSSLGEILPAESGVLHYY